MMNAEQLSSSTMTRVLKTGEYVREEIILKGDGEDLYVWTFATPRDIERLAFDPQFTEHPNYRSLYTQRESLIAKARQEDNNVVLALTRAGNIIGFGVLVRPDPMERWSQLKPDIMMELEAIEVSREWRSRGIGKAIVEAMLAHPKVEDEIVYLVGYHWTWDLEGSRLTPEQYKKMMIRLFSPAGFVEYETNEPNVSLSPDNLFMARVGKRVSEETRNNFKWLCFGQYP